MIVRCVIIQSGRTDLPIIGNGIYRLKIMMRRCTHFRSYLTCVMSGTHSYDTLQQNIRIHWLSGNFIFLRTEYKFQILIENHITFLGSMFEGIVYTVLKTLKHFFCHLPVLEQLPWCISSCSLHHVKKLKFSYMTFWCLFFSILCFDIRLFHILYPKHVCFPWFSWFFSLLLYIFELCI